MRERERANERVRERKKREDEREIEMWLVDIISAATTSY